MAEVILENICKIYEGDVKAVSNANLRINDREFMVLVGPSGCGKSTALRMIAGLEEITQGTITIGKRVVNDIPPKDRDIAMVFQNYALYPHMSVYENMAFGLKLHKFKKMEIDVRVKEAANILGLADYLVRRPKALSGGQRQRVAVGRAIVRKPEVFLFDEPLSNLDAKMRVQMRTEISKLHSQLGATMIYVTHDQVEAMTMGSRICVMKDGVIQQVDTPINIYDNPANIFVAGFIGTPPMNFFEGEIKRNNDELSFLGKTFELPICDEEHHKKLLPFVGQEVVLGIRPENIHFKATRRDSALPQISAKVEVIEPMGSETLLYMNTGAESFIAKVDPHRKVSLTSEVMLSLDLSKAHFFAKSDEKAIV